MKRQIPGLHEAAENGLEGPEGLFLVAVERAIYRFHPQKPFFQVSFLVFEPPAFAGQHIPGRLYCHVKALWKLNWFLKDFSYDAELLCQDEIDDKALIGLRGVIKVRRAVVNGRSYLNLDGFARSEQWEAIQQAQLESCQTS